MILCCLYSSMDPFDISTCLPKSFFTLPYEYEGRNTMYTGPYSQPYYSFSTPKSMFGSEWVAMHVK